MTNRQCTKLRAAQQQMLQSMLGYRPAREETKADFMHRVNARIRQIKDHEGVMEWDLWYHREMFRWAGHVARMPQYAPNRLTHKVLAYRFWDWITSVASANHGNQLHGKRFKTWRWERPSYKYFNDARWQLVAQDRLEWNTRLDAMTTWRRNHR